MTPSFVTFVPIPCSTSLISLAIALCRIYPVVQSVFQLPFPVTYQDQLHYSIHYYSLRLSYKTIKANSIFDHREDPCV